MTLEIEIFGSSQYVDPSEQKGPWYQLSVINQWDWKTKPICSRYLGTILIPYCLHKCTTVSGNHYLQEVVDEPTEDMKATLIGMGYAVE